jgi:hypothetical protein
MLPPLIFLPSKPQAKLLDVEDRRGSDMRRIGGGAQRWINTAFGEMGDSTSERAAGQADLFLSRFSCLPHDANFFFFFKPRRGFNNLPASLGARR